jgi:hypothetical protein
MVARAGLRNIRIVAARLFLRGKKRHHRIHVAGGDPEKIPGRAKGREIRRVLYIRHRDDADRAAERLNVPPHHCGAERGMVNIRVAGHDDDVELLDAELLHFLPSCGEKCSGVGWFLGDTFHILKII